MKKKHIYIVLITIVVLLMFSSNLFALIRTILGGSVDGTQPTAPPPPTIVTRISTSAVIVSRNGSFYGITNNRVRYDSDGVDNWTQTSSFPTTNNRGFEFISSSSRMLVVKSIISNCGVSYSNDLGNSWTDVTLSGSNICNITIPYRDGIICKDSTCYVFDHFNGGSLGRHIYKSVDGGLSWSLNYTGTLGCWQCRPLYYDGTNVIAGSGYDSNTCGSSFYGLLYISTDNGSSWNEITANCATDGLVAFNAAVKFGSTYYIAATTRSSTPIHGQLFFWTSTDLVNWTKGIPSDLTFTPAPTSFKYPFRMYAGNQYNPPTMYIGFTDTAHDTFVIYTSTDGKNFTRIYDRYSVYLGSGIDMGNIISDSDNILYFGDEANWYYKITK